MAKLTKRQRELNEHILKSVTGKTSGRFAHLDHDEKIEYLRQLETRMIYEDEFRFKGTTDEYKGLYRNLLNEEFNGEPYYLSQYEIDILTDDEQ